MDKLITKLLFQLYFCTEYMWATKVAPLLANQPQDIEDNDYGVTKEQKEEMTRGLNTDGRKWGTWG